MKTLSLNGEWQVRECGTGNAYPAIVPGVVHMDLERAGVIPNVDWRDNEKLIQWVTAKDWDYVRTFEVDEDFLKQRQIVLCCEGLDTLAEVFVNGTCVMKTDNMFRGWECDVKGALKVGTNEIRVFFKSIIPVMAECQKVKVLPCWNSFAPEYRGKSWLRKMPCSFGWDWGPMVPTCGIYRDICLKGYDEGRLTDVEVLQKHEDNGDVTLTFNISSELQASDMMVCAGARACVGGASTDVLTLAEGTTTATVVVRDAKKWWPNGLGEQNLYEAYVTLCDAAGNVVDSWKRRIGLRTIELDRHEDEWGECFQFKVNGKAFFAKGANWVPADVLIPRLTREKYHQLISAAAYANMNFLRVWGGGFYEQEDFYDECDEQGILLWHDFMFACSTYPTFDEAFMENCKGEFENVLRRLRTHPSMGLLCGNNELEQGLVADEWNQHSMSWADYSKMFDVMLPEVCARLMPEVPYWPGSPHTPHGDRRNFNDPSCGDAHCWTVWFGGQPFEAQRTWTHRFMSEFGFQSFPELKTIKSFTEPKDRNLTSYIMDYHQRSGNGNRKIFAYLLDWFKMPDGLEETLWMTQVSQAMCIQYACEHARRMQPRMMGVLYWQINDIWPCASWSSIDSFGRWKALHYLARRFYAPLLVSLLEKTSEHKVEVHVSNTTFESRKVTVKWQLTTLAGDIQCQGEKDVEAGAQADLVADVVDTLKAEEVCGVRDLILFAQLECDGEVVSTNHCTLTVPKHLELQKPVFDVTVADDESSEDGGFVIRVKTDKPSVMVRLELTQDDAQFSDNFFTMYAGQERVLTAQPWKPMDLETFKSQLRVKSLYDSTAEIAD